MARTAPRLLLGAMAASLIMLAGSSVSTERDQRLSARSRDLLAAAAAAGDRSVTLLVAASPGSARSVASALRSIGQVRYEDDDLGYIRVIVALERAEAAAAVAGIEAVEVDELTPLPDPRPSAEDGATAAAVPPDGSTPPLNPYMPTQDIGAPQFVAANPTWDGRGVVIGIVDLGIDLLTPELQTGKTLAGAIVPKFRDWVTMTDPLTDGDPTWINMKDQVTVSGGSFTYKGVTYTGAPNGSFRVGVFNEASLGTTSEYGPAVGATCAGSDLNRNGVCGELFAVLWRTKDNMVWVDANADRSFAGETPMTDYKVARHARAFGTDNPATPLRESVPFVVQTNGKDKYVNIGIVSGAHGTHVAGIAAGKDFFGGAFDGAAPEAQLVSVRACLFVAGCTAHALLEGMIYTAKQSNVDVINMSIGGLPALNDGNNARAILYNRLIEQTNAQMFLSAGNSYPGMNSVGDPSVATKAMSIGAYVSADTFYVNYNAIVPKEDGIFTFSSRGPREDGGLKPDVIAPGAAVSTIPKWGRNFPIVALPAGYDMYNGTSMAAPQAAGGAALLVSAAKQAGVQSQPDQLRQAIHSTARFLPAYGAYEQGSGLFDVGAAWEALATNLNTDEIVSQAPVATVLSGFLATPGFGPGIYQREGLAAGATRTLDIVFTRTKGPSQAKSYDLSWLGNDGTFSSATSIALARGVAVALPVTVTPPAPGVHSAILRLQDPATGVNHYQVLNTVVATQPFTAANNFSVTYDGIADVADKATFFFDVPAGTTAFRVDVTNVNGRARVLRYHPYGVPFDSLNTAFQTGGSHSRTAVNPFPGVWEVVVEVSRSSVASPTTFTVTGSVLGVSIAPSPDIVETATIGVPVARSYTVTNVGAAFTGAAAGGALGSAFADRTSIAAGGAQRQVTITVPAGATRLDVRIGNPSDLQADLDLFLFNCTSGSCVLVAQSASGSSEEAVGLNNPAPGAWVALVDPYEVPAGSTEYDYLDLIAAPGLGSIVVTDANALRPTGASWTVPAIVTATAAPAAGRHLRGQVLVQAQPGSVTVGSALVIVNSVVQ